MSDKLVQDYGNREISLGLRPRPKLIHWTGLYGRYYSDDDDACDGLGYGYGIFGDMRTNYRLNYIDTGEVWKHSGRKKIKRETVEAWRVLRISVCFGERICDIYVRLWRTNNDAK
jgi:hypothetical protein